MMDWNLRPYPDYKDSGVPWLGEIPEHWTINRAKWLFRKAKRMARPYDEVVTCFRDGVVTLRKNRRLSGYTESIKEIGYQGVRRGDLVIHAMDAFAGAIGVSDSDGKCSPVYSICNPIGNANSRYYCLIVRQMALSQWIFALSKGIRERSTDFRFDIFASQLVPTPPQEEQSGISKFLNIIDQRIRRYIRAKKKLIALLNEQKQAIIQRAVTRGLDPNVRLKPSGVEWLGDIPEHWETWKIGHFAKIGNGSTPHRSQPEYWAKSGFPWLNSSCVNEGIVIEGNQFVTDLALRECHLPQVMPNSVLVAITGQGKTRGTSAILKIKATINQHIAYITIKNKKISTEYLHLSLISAYTALRALSENAGSTKGALTCGDLRHFKIAIPPHDEQNKIFSFIELETSYIGDSIDILQQKINLLIEYRTRLIANVVTGKLDVREAAKDLPQETDEPDPSDGPGEEEPPEEEGEDMEAMDDLAD